MRILMIIALSAILAGCNGDRVKQTEFSRARHRPIFPSSNETAPAGGQAGIVPDRAAHGGETQPTTRNAVGASEQSRRSSRGNE